MAELATSMVAGPLLSLVKDKVGNYLLEQYKVMEGMEKQHKILKRKLPAILDIMDDAEKQASHREGVKAWLQELKTVAYEANDVFDEFEYEALRRRAKKEGHITKLGIAGLKLFPTHNRVAFRNRMGNKLSAIVETIEVLVAEMNAFGFKHQIEGAPAHKEWRETDHNIIDPINIVSRSRDQESKKIIEILLKVQACSDGDLMVVPIVGMGGLGKTTLAQLIYNDPRVQKHFQLLKWVCVSDDFNVRDLANKICDAPETILEKALNKLQDELKGKRYLLVLDDIWNKDVGKWQKLKASLKHGGVGSAILATTRDKEIAEFMGTVVESSWTNKYHDVAVLDNKFIQEIIEARAGLSNRPKGKRDKLVNLVGQFVKRCAGSPLAANALGSVLRNKTTKQEWEDVSQQSSICSDDTGILPILKLSYDDLPSNMRQCFAFCALYPKDYEIDVDNLIQLWMANGFISDKKKVHAETVGEHIIKEMVSRSFFQYVDQDPTRFGYSSTTLLKIHDLMHDVAVSASEKEYVYLTDEIIQSNDELLPSVVRHIHYLESEEQRLDISFDFLRRMSTPIQTLVIGKSYGRRVHHSSEHSSLRALSFPKLSGRHYPLTVKPKHLHHLRYLDLSHSEMEALPDDISILYNLQTLKLSGCRRLRGLPKQMKYMTGLRHLYTDGCDRLACMPPELGRLTSLQTITCFVLGSGKDCSGLGELKDLNIGGSLELTRLENVAKATGAKSANLGKKKELRQLSLSWTRGGKEEQEEEKQCGHGEVLEALEAHDGLLALEIYSYQGNRFPPWMGTLRNMVELRLFDCRKTEQLPPFHQLPELQLLHLTGLEKLQSLCSMSTPSSVFGKLKELRLADLDGFDSFFSEAGQGEVVAFPQLEVLYIYNCKSLKALPDGAVVVLSETHGGGDNNNAMARSAFPRLKTLTLEDLRSFERWEAADATLEINAAEQPQILLFPLLEKVCIERCPQLATLPRAPKLGELYVEGAKEDMPTLELSDVVNGDNGKEGDSSWDHYMSSVTVMHLYWSDGFFLGSRVLLALWACFGQLQDLTIRYCHQLVYWPEKEFRGLVSLRTLAIWNCKGLIGYASHAHDEQATTSEEEERRSQLLPRLESLDIYYCESLVEVLSAPAALKRMSIYKCGKLESLSLLSGKQLQDKTPSSSSLKHHHQGGGSSSIEDVTAASTTAAAAVQEEDISLPAAASTSHQMDNLSLLPPSPSSSLVEYLYIDGCDGLSELLSLPPSLREITIDDCSNLRLLSGQLDALKEIYIYGCPELRSLESILTPAVAAASLESLSLVGCRSLASLPTAGGPQAGDYYSSLRKLVIRRCPGIKSLPSALQQRLDCLEVKDLDDARLEAAAGPGPGPGGGLLGRLCSRLSPPSCLGWGG